MFDPGIGIGTGVIGVPIGAGIGTGIIIGGENALPGCGLIQEFGFFTPPVTGVGGGGGNLFLHLLMHSPVQDVLAQPAGID